MFEFRLVLHWTLLQRIRLKFQGAKVLGFHVYEGKKQILTVFWRFENAIWMLDFSRRFSISCLNMNYRRKKTKFGWTVFSYNQPGSDVQGTDTGEVQWYFEQCNPLYCNATVILWILSVACNSSSLQVGHSPDTLGGHGSRKWEWKKKVWGHIYTSKVWL